MEQDGTEILLTGSHTWSVLADNGEGNPPTEFDYKAYLDFLEANGHNFFRLWAWEQTRWTLETADDRYWFFPQPYLRTASGDALDGRPKFDLDQFNPAYFERLRERVIQARDRGFYVAIVLFNGWSVASAKEGFAANNPWKGHPFNAENNINGIDGDLNHDSSGEEVHELNNPAVLALEEAYIRQVIDIVNDLDNVLYEISNESHSGSVGWQYHMIDFIHTYEAQKRFQHPVGMTAPWPGGNNEDLFNSPAEWISINDEQGDLNEPRIADGRKVLLTDTDHLCGVCGDRTWVWKAFMRGHNPIFMDVYDGAGYGVGASGFDASDPAWVSARANMGYILTYANRMNLSRAIPQPRLCSSTYCLGNLTPSEAQILVYLPQGGLVSLDLTEISGELAVEWFDPQSGVATPGATTAGGAEITLTAPFSGEAVLFLFQPLAQ